MRRLLLFVVMLNCIAMHAFAQNPDSIEVRPQKLTEMQRDSIMLDIEKSVKYLANREFQREICRYKVYSTNNIWTSLKLDTATGRITALQIGMNTYSQRREYTVADSITEAGFVGRFELYPTGNMYNFILLDTVLGYAWQIQWSTDAKQCGRLMIF